MKHIKDHTKLFEDQVGQEIKRSESRGIFDYFAPLNRAAKIEKIEMCEHGDGETYYPVVFMSGLRPIRFHYLSYRYGVPYYAKKEEVEENYRLNSYGSLEVWYNRINLFAQDLEKETGITLAGNFYLNTVGKVAEAIELLKGTELKEVREFDWMSSPIGQDILELGFYEVTTGNKKKEHRNNLYFEHPLLPYRYSVTKNGYIRRKRKVDGVNLYGFVVRTNPIITVEKFLELLSGLKKTLDLDAPPENKGIITGWMMILDKGLSYCVGNNIPLPYSDIIKVSDKIKSRWEAGGFDKEKAAKLEKRWNILQRDV